MEEAVVVGSGRQEGGLVCALRCREEDVGDRHR